MAERYFSSAMLFGQMTLRDQSFLFSCLGLGFALLASYGRSLKDVDFVSLFKALDDKDEEDRKKERDRLKKRFIYSDEVQSEAVESDIELVELEEALEALESSSSL